MTRMKTVLVGALLAASPLALAAAEPPVAEIDVSADFSAVDGANALEFWPDLEADLEARIAEAVAPMMTDDGGRVQVIVNEVSVDGVALLQGEGEFNTLSGGIFYYPPEAGDEGTTPQTASITVVATPDYSQAATIEGPVLIMPPTDGTVYDAMLDGFARVVAERLTDL